MKYKLNYDWLNYKKGHVFESSLKGFYYNDSSHHTGDWLEESILNLLLKSGALSEVEEEKCKPDCEYCKIINNMPIDTPKLPEPLVHWKGEGHTQTATDIFEVIDTVNAIIKYLQSK